VDLNEALRPSLQIMDGIIAMEGDGPSSGTPCPVGRILASPDWTAIDMIACRMIGISPPDVPTIKAAMERGDISSDQINIRLTGDESDLPVIQGFRMPSTYRGEGRGLEKSLLLSTLHKLGRLSTLYPDINRSTCVQCGRCVMICPVRAISFDSKIPEINRKACIRCYCCHEICPEGAIRLKPGLACMMIRKLTGRG
jgi:ferredoxin